MVTEQSPKHNVLQTTIRKCPLPLISVSFILFTHLHPSPPHSPSLPPHLCTPGLRHTFGIMLHVQANCAAKGIISVHCRRSVNQSSLCLCHRAPTPHTTLPHTPQHTHINALSIHAVSSSAPTYSVPAGQGALHIPARPLLSGPHGPMQLGREGREGEEGAVAYPSQPVTQCGGKCGPASQSSQHGQSMLICRDGHMPEGYFLLFF